ncbi:MAG: hypothetical protein AVDCRST_MAG73-3774 [uncultured Thermomicrobiales bacterium]|uniref:Lipoprotein n=1 Tax=uncultured Thermomicrobiales bacterium TaxID=1645740 RepID=A0A6J4UWE0_9BACT|nr:MAG: hypothetical protein AVDCRST_MAG73-3774 [uncultured Thermomicrobiales bacterium]
MGTRSFPRKPAARFAKLGLWLLLSATLAGCTGRGGGWLPPDAILFSGQATLGFSFSCERSSASYNLNPPTGQLRIQLNYTDHGTSPLGGPFSIHGEADTVDPVLESMICIGEEPPPGAHELIFLGQYELTSSPPSGFPAECAGPRPDPDRPRCRFEAVVRDNDGNRAPSGGDEFSIKLSTTTVTGFEVDPGAVVYARSGVLGGGNLEID